MAKKKTPPRRDAYGKPVVEEPVVPSGTAHALRETVESIVIAFVLAFLFRTFEAEAFVIPTGSMSPSLQGQHKDVHCSECGYRFRTTASSEGEERDRLLPGVLEQRQVVDRLQQELEQAQSTIQRENIQPQLRREVEELTRRQQDYDSYDVIAGMCPMCRQTMLFRTDGLPTSIPGFINPEGVETATSYPGDRILVNKYSYGGDLPQRWDVVVFKFPGNGEMNYIKRLVGMPGETLQVYQGDIFVKNTETGDFEIERKPPEKVRAMLEPVHDTAYDPSVLFNAGWPLRWEPIEANGWKISAEAKEKNVAQQFTIDQQDTGTVAWLRYRHRPPADEVWAIAHEFARTGNNAEGIQSELRRAAQGELITDFNPYNARIARGHINNGRWRLEPHELGMEWVSDLAVECDVNVEEARGQLYLDLVEGGRHFTCRIDLKTGKASLYCDGAEEFRPEAQTSVNSAGSYQLCFANVDDQLLLWVDGELVDFGDSTYDADEVFADRDNIMPRTGASDPGDLAPVGIGASGARLAVTRLRVLRDIYYIAVNNRDTKVPTQWSGQTYYFLDYQPPRDAVNLADGTRLPAVAAPRTLFQDPATWPRFLTRQKREFPLKDGQLFVMGDNSPESQDCRLWRDNPSPRGRPGGAYLDTRLLTGKAVCVFWPHSWGSIPGLEVLPGFPNFKDMRIVR